MIKKHYYSWTDVERMCVSIVNQMYKDNWRPDYIVGITRGGNIPATIISNMTGIRCEALKVSLRDGEKGGYNDSAAWMASDDITKMIVIGHCSITVIVNGIQMKKAKQNSLLQMKT